MLIQGNYYSYQSPNRSAFKANTSKLSNCSQPVQNSANVSFEGAGKASSVCKKVAIGAIIVTGLLIAGDVIFNKGKNLKRLQKKFLGLFPKKTKPKAVGNNVSGNNFKAPSDVSNSVAYSVKPNKPTAGKPKVKVHEVKTPKGKLIQTETIEVDTSGKITKFTVESPKRGTTATYNYQTGEYTVKGAKFKVKNAAGEVVEEVKTVTYPVEKINPEDINFTQRSMGENYAEIAQSLRENGWQGQPVDVIRTKDGKYISMDNRRIAAAREAGVDVHAIVHELDEPLTAGKQIQYRVQDPKSKDGFVPETWGEAIYNRLYQNGLTTTSGTIDIVAAHNVPSIVPDVLLDTRKASLFELYFGGHKPYSPFYF